MKIKYADKIYQVVDTVEFDGRIYYTVEDEPGHYDTFTNISDKDIVDPSPINRRAKHMYKTRKLEEELDEEIKDTQEKLKELYDRKNKLTSEQKFDNIQVGKMYKFYESNTDIECVHYGVITSISYDSEKRSWRITYAGIYNNLIHDAQKFEDCQYGGFDADVEVIIPCHEEDFFIKNCTPIDKYEYYQAVDDLYSNIMERSNYWLAKYCE